MPNNWTCSACGDRVDDEPPYCEIQGDLVCDECCDDVFNCDVCGEYEWDENSRSVSDQTLCDTCFTNTHFTCGVCSNNDRQEHSRRLLNMSASACEECYDSAISCADCGGRTHRPAMYSRRNYCNECLKTKLASEIRSFTGNSCDCDDCVAKDKAFAVAAWSCNYMTFKDRMSAWSCSICGASHYSTMPLVQNWRQLLRWLIEETRMPPAMCVSCMDGGGAAEGYIVNSYSYKPVPSFKRSNRDLEIRALHFGTEVEIEMSGSEHTRDALKLLSDLDEKHKLFYCKSDSCIRNGFEVVSHPFTYDWMKENEDAFDAMFSLSKMMKGFKSANCGMHVHMSIDAFTNLQLLKFMRFFYKNKEFITAIARRPPGKLVQWAGMQTPAKGNIQKYVVKKTGGVGTGRAALNVEGSKTIECRIFRSTLSPTAYYGNVEFLQALFDYTKTCGLHQLQHDRFIGYASDRGSAYKNFITLTKTIRPMSVED